MSHPFTPRRAAAAVLVLTLLAGCGAQPLNRARQGQTPAFGTAPAGTADRAELVPAPVPTLLPEQATDAPAALPALDGTDLAAADAMRASTDALVHEMPTGGALAPKGQP